MATTHRFVATTWHNVLGTLPAELRIESGDTVVTDTPAALATSEIPTRLPMLRELSLVCYPHVCAPRAHTIWLRRHSSLRNRSIALLVTLDNGKSWPAFAGGSRMADVRFIGHPPFTTTT